MSLNRSLNGALLVNKPKGISSFAVIEILQDLLRDHYGFERRDLPKLGHGGTLDPFATGVLVVLVGRGAKLARYFLNSSKSYAGVIRFGETTIPGDPTDPISERSEIVPKDASEIQTVADNLCQQVYLQTPPMHSAKKHNGRPLYELARQGLEVEREAKSCFLKEFKIHSYSNPDAAFSVHCSAGTYIRTLAQDLGRLLGTVAYLTNLERTACGSFKISNSLTLDEIEKASLSKTSWDELSNWIPFDFLLHGFPKAEATPEEALALQQGKQNVLFSILNRSEMPEKIPENIAIYSQNKLTAMLKRGDSGWEIERVFTS